MKYQKYKITDRNRFDNPTYVYQSNPRNDDVDHLLNNMQIRNILTRKNTNSDKGKSAKSGYSDEEEDPLKGNKCLINV